MTQAIQLEIGAYYENEGVYVGRCCFEGYKKGVPKGREFEIFTTKEDFGFSKSYDRAVERISEADDLHGHDDRAVRGRVPGSAPAPSVSVEPPRLDIANRRIQTRDHREDASFAAKTREFHR